MKTLLSTEKLTVGYLKRGSPIPVIQDLTLSLGAGELVCLIGQNGAGKSTLLRTLAGIQAPLTGSVQVNGHAITGMNAREIAQHLSIVLTEKGATGLLTVRELVALGRYPYTDWVGRLTPADHAVIEESLKLAGATRLVNRRVMELSDGERQKVMIARALAQGTPLLMLDEPTAYLDWPRRVEMLHLLRELAHRTGRAILLSTHDLELALRHADRLWVVQPGGILSHGTAEDLVLSGAFEQAFASEGLIFDPLTGDFQRTAAPAPEIILHADGLAGTWTRRALERVGYRVLEGISRPGVARVEVGNQIGTVWRVYRGEQCVEYPSIEDLLTGLPRPSHPHE
jgi:iron complex transport system ATP-binding protein